jgi:GrpB-like predicted nucleotidyltransferase (UPF0157 family)
MSDTSFEDELIGGTEKREITIVDHDASWAGKFEAHSRLIANALGGTALRTEHIGSTSVPGLAAKPIIDILVVVADSANESSYLPRLESVGYGLRVREPNWHRHRMFRTEDQSVHVHVYSRGCPEIDRCLIFRDRLRRNVCDRSRYEQTKRRLAAEDWPDMNAYAAAKTEVVEDIIAAASAAGENPTEAC